MNEHGSFAVHNGYARMSDRRFFASLSVPHVCSCDEPWSERKDSVKMSSSLGWTQQPWKSS